MMFLHPFSEGVFLHGKVLRDIEDDAVTGLLLHHATDGLLAALGTHIELFDLRSDVVKGRKGKHLVHDVTRCDQGSNNLHCAIGRRKKKGLESAKNV